MQFNKKLLRGNLGLILKYSVFLQSIMAWPSVWWDPGYLFEWSANYVCFHVCAGSLWAVSELLNIVNLDGFCWKGYIRVKDTFPFFLSLNCSHMFEYGWALSLIWFGIKQAAGLDILVVEPNTFVTFEETGKRCFICHVLILHFIQFVVLVWETWSLDRREDSETM